MSRVVERRLVVEGRLICATALHAGGLESRSGADLALSVNGAGCFYLPGTGLAGPMRRWCRETFGIEATQSLWGFQRQGDSDAGHASFVLVEDAVVEGDAIPPEIRDGVGIDRLTGTAAPRFKFAREVLPAGTALKLRMVVDVPPGKPDKPEVLPMLAAMLQALENGEIRFGAAKSRGLGKVVLENLTIAEHRLTTRDGILAVLERGTGNAASGDDRKQVWPDWESHRRIPPLIEIVIGWQPVGPLMVKASADGMTVDTLPRLAQHRDRSLRLALPGSSSRGALRTQAERIVTTLFRPEPEKEFLAQLDRHALIGTLFGARNDPRYEDDDAEEEDDAAPPLPGLASLACEDCNSEEPLAPETLEYILGTAPGADHNDVSAFEKALPEYRKETGAPCLDPAVHVAIDRWTGGAADGALFSVLEPRGFTWEPLRLTVDPRRLARRSDDKCTDGEAVALAALGLLLLTLGDLAAGEVPLGFATNRGFGRVEVESIKITVPDADHAREERVRSLLTSLKPLNGAICTGGKLVLEPGRVEAIETAWRAYLAAHGVETEAGRADAGGGI